VLEFLIEETERAFDSSLPLDQQARAALLALRDFDSDLAKQYEEVLVGFSNGQHISGAFLVEDIAPDLPDSDAPVTAENVVAVIIAGCKYKLWTSREAQLLALRRGFSTHAALMKDPIDLASHLAMFDTPDLMLLVEGRTEPVSKVELLERCITWPMCLADDLEAGFPRGSTTCQLLRSLLEDEDEFTPERRVAFLEWATSRTVMPVEGLESTPSGRIKLKWDEGGLSQGDETMWSLPRARTCFHSIYLPNYACRGVLKSKLWLALDHRKDGFAEVDN